VVRSGDWVAVVSERPFQCLSSGALGGGRTAARTLLNLHVHKGYSGMNPAADLASAAAAGGLPTPVVGLMTAVQMGEVMVFTDGPLLLVATVGLGNPEAAGATPPFATRPGTINLMLVADGDLSDHALVGVVITLTEAKVRALARLGVQCPVTGEAATGTTSDAVTVACTGNRPDFPFAGPGTSLGALAAQLTYRAVITGGERNLRSVKMPVASQRKQTARGSWSGHRETYVRGEWIPRPATPGYR